VIEQLHRAEISLTLIRKLACELLASFDSFDVAVQHDRSRLDAPSTLCVHAIHHLLVPRKALLLALELDRAPERAVE
jgi:hypothetical protein